MRTRRASDVRAVLPAIQVPTLVMQTAHHEWVERACHAASLIPGASFVEIPGAEELPLWRTSDRVVEETSQPISPTKTQGAWWRSSRRRPGSP
jgi:pimeloyl-ACP methyl ester carboxylesterase